MGGAVAFIVAHACVCPTDHWHASLGQFSAACRGVILAAPALRVKMPWFAHGAVVGVLKTVMQWTVLPLLPALALPGGIAGPSPAAAHPIWDSDECVIP